MYVYKEKIKKEITYMNDIQKDFFNSLQEIQQLVVNLTICNYKKGDNIEELLEDITYDTIYMIMELIDGYSNHNLQLDIIDRYTRESIRTGIELHDICADYLKCKK